MQQRIVPNLWFDTEAEEAANFYVSVFKEGRIINTMRYPENSPGPTGEVMTVEWEVNGNRFVGINGGSGPGFKFSEAISFMITCDDQDEVDYFWDALREGGGEEGPCGWLKDRFGVSWQVVPKGMVELFGDPDLAKSQRAFEAMMKMKKLDLATLMAAAEGEAASG